MVVYGDFERQDRLSEIVSRHRQFPGVFAGKGICRNPDGHPNRLDRIFRDVFLICDVYDIREHQRIILAWLAESALAVLRRVENVGHDIFHEIRFRHSG